MSGVVPVLLRLPLKNWEKKFVVEIGLSMVKRSGPSRLRLFIVGVGNPVAGSTVGSNDRKLPRVEEPPEKVEVNVTAPVGSLDSEVPVKVPSPCAVTGLLLSWISGAVPVLVRLPSNMSRKSAVVMGLLLALRRGPAPVPLRLRPPPREMIEPSVKV